MIDIHCHIVPRVDDGAENDAEALRMGHEAYRQGIHTIIATPHHATAHYRNEGGVIRSAVHQLNQLLQKHYIHVKIMAGQEFRLNDDYEDEYRAGNIQLLGESRYLLTELPNNRIPACFERFVQFMKDQSIEIIVAHPERHQMLMSRPDLLLQWTNNGVLFQITSLSLLGGFGKRPMQAAYSLIRQGYAHLLASDAHSSRHRSFLLREGYAAVERELSRSYAEHMKSNAEKVIANESVNC